jgi:hypothetical protein
MAVSIKKIKNNHLFLTARVRHTFSQDIAVIKNALSVNVGLIFYASYGWNCNVMNKNL